MNQHSAGSPISASARVVGAVREPKPTQNTIRSGRGDPRLRRLLCGKAKPFRTAARQSRNENDSFSANLDSFGSRTAPPSCAAIMRPKGGDPSQTSDRV